MSATQDYAQKLNFQKEFTATGIVGPTELPVINAVQTVVVVENVGATNEVTVSGKIKGQDSFILLDTIVGPTDGTAIDTATVDELQFECTVYDPSGSPKLVASGFFKKPTSGGGGEANTASNIGVGGVGLFSSKVGVDLKFKNINAGSSKITVTNDNPNKEVDIDVDEAALDIGNMGGVGSISNDSFASFGGTGDLQSLVGWSVNSVNGAQVSNTFEPNNLSGGQSVHSFGINVEPLQNSPDELVLPVSFSASIDPTSTGFTIGTNGNGVTLESLNISHQGTSDVGSLAMLSTNYAIGNGTDPIDVNGFAYGFGFGNVNANVTVSGPIQGWGFQPSINASATVSSYVIGFYDTANSSTSVDGWQSFVASPTVSEITNNSNYTGLSVGPNITTFTGNAGMTGVGVFPSITSMDTGSFQGVSVSPTIGDTKGATGLLVNMNNVTAYAGVQASLVIQDITIEAQDPGTFQNTITIEYANDGTAGSETVTFSSPAFVVHMQSGVSTATQIKAALDGFPTFSGDFTATITGTASNTQVTQAATPLAGGENAGNVRSADLTGDVQITGDVGITGSLSFTGSLGIGQLSAFYAVNPVDAGGTPTTVHGMISSQTALNGVTVANADTIGVNTAALITLETNSVTTSGPFGLGLASLALPCVVTTHTGATLDNMTMAAYALSLDGSSTGGTIDVVHGCRVVGIPNGITTINNFRGFEYSLPFGSVSALEHGLYIEGGNENWIASRLVVGTSDTAANTSVGIEIDSVTKALLLSRMTTTERDALTAINGMVIYNTTLGKFQGYEAGAWTSLI